MLNEGGWTLTLDKCQASQNQIGLWTQSGLMGSHSESFSHVPVELLCSLQCRLAHGLKQQSPDGPFLKSDGGKLFLFFFCVCVGFFLFCFCFLCFFVLCFVFAGRGVSVGGWGGGGGERK